MNDKISFEDLKSRFVKNSTELEEIDRLNIDYKSIIENKKKMIENYEQIIASIKPDNQKDFESQSKDYMEKIHELEDEIRIDEGKAGRKEKLIKENKKIIEDAKTRKENLEKQVLEDYEKDKKEEEKNMSDDLKKAKSELENYESQLSKMEEDEIKFPNKVKDSKYKEFLRNKIAEKNKYIKENDNSSAEKTKESLLNKIREEYLAFKKGLSKEYMPLEARNPNPVLEKAKEKRKENLINTNDNSSSEKDKGTGINKDIKVIIGRKGKISYDGKDYKVGSKIIKEAINMLPSDVINLLEENNFKVSKDLEIAIKTGLETGTLDSTVLSTICSAKKMPNRDKKEILTNYLKEGILAANRKDAKNSINLVYDQEDMSKSSIIKRFLGIEIDAEEKYRIMKKARVGERHGIAKTEGEYKPTIRSKIISFISGNEIKALPTMSETQEVAETYNKMRDSLKVDTKDLSKAQKVELDELKKSQEKQEER